MYEDLLPYTFATWIFTLHVAGVPANDEGIRRACAEVLAATDASAGEAAAGALVAAAKARLTNGEAETVLAVARSLYGDRARADLGDPDRDLRLARIRKYQFTSQLPWLARIWERNGGKVGPSWVLVERMTDEVLAADPNPWNAIDEARHLPLADFHVLWELDGLTHVHVV
jgi:hypothetical protein